MTFNLLASSNDLYYLLITSINQPQTFQINQQPLKSTNQPKISTNDLKYPLLPEKLLQSFQVEYVPKFQPLIFVPVQIVLSADGSCIQEFKNRRIIKLYNIFNK